MQKELLLEGGLAGHMAHLYENPDLKFSDIKEIFRKASEGELEGTEKTDGQNLFISYNIASGEARAARNQGEIKKGGLNASELAQKFGGRGSLEVAFTEAFSSFEKAAQSLSNEEAVELFGQQGEIFYNCEIQDPRNPNVIQYSAPVLNIHRVGHLRIDDKKILPLGDSSDQLIQKLESSIQKLREQEVETKFKIQVNAIRRLEKVENKDIANLYIQKIEKLATDNGLSDSDTLGDFLTLKVVPMIIEDFPNIPEERMEILMQRLFQGTSVGLAKIKKGLPKELHADISAAVKKLKNYFKVAIKPVEIIIHDFAVEILKNFQSAFVLDEDEEVKRLRKLVAKSIEQIKRSGYEEAIEILNVHLEKLKDAENLFTAAEGFVFDYNGQTYKFTGNFAPANQLLGLFKFGRGQAIPPLKNLDNLENNEGVNKNKIVLLPGGYRPPTKAHYEMIKFYSELPNVEKVIVLVGPAERAGFSREQSVRVFEDLYSFNDKVEILTTDIKSSGTAAFEFLISDERKEPYKGLAFTMGRGDKGSDAKFSRYFRDYFLMGRPDRLPEGFYVDIIQPFPVSELDGEAISGTALRKAVKKGDVETVKNMIPDGVDPEKYISIYKGEELTEASSVAAGNLAGYSGRSFKEDEEDEDSEKKKRKKLQELIKRGIESVKEKRRIEEAKFRQIVQALVVKKYKTLLEQEEMKAGERSTAINYLEKVLKMIIPGKVGGSQLEPEYSALSTAAERRSFIKHVIQGLYDEIAPDISLDGLISRFEGRREAFSQKDKQPLMEQEDIKITLDAEGLPKTEKEIEDEELAASDGLTTGKVTDRGPEDDFPEPLSGENSIGRKAAYRFISTQKATIENALKDLQMTPEELDIFKSENPNKEEPQVEFLDFLFTNIALHFDRLENKYFNSEVSISEDFFQNVLKQAADEKEAGADIATASDQAESDLGTEEEEVELDLGEETPEGEEELELEL